MELAICSVVIVVHKKFIYFKKSAIPMGSGGNMFSLVSLKQSSSD